MTNTEYRQFVATHFGTLNQNMAYLNAYALGLWLAHIMAHSTWRLASAALKYNLPTLEVSMGKVWNESLPILSDTELREFYSFCEKYSLKEYIINFTPGFLPQGTEVLSGIESDLIAKHHARYELPLLIIKAREAFADTSIEDPFKNFSSLSPLPNSVLAKIFATTNLYPFGEIRSRTDGTAMRAIRKLREAGCSDEYILEKFIEARIILCKEKWLRKTPIAAEDAAHMVRKSKDIHPHIDTGFEAILNEAYKDMANVSKPSNFIGALVVDHDTDDTALDCGVVRLRFLNQCHPGKNRILLINPSPYFLQQFPEELHSSATCIYYNHQVSEILSHEFEKIRFTCSLKQASVQQFDRVLFFAHGLDDATSLKVLTHLTSTSAAFWQEGEIQVCALFPIKLINSSQALRIATTVFSPGLFSILPDKVSLSVPRKKVLFWGSTEKGSASVGGTFGEIIEHLEIGGIRYLSRARGASAVPIPPKSFVNDDPYFSLRKLTNTLTTLPLPDERQRDGAKYSQFSRELKIWYKVSDATPALKAASVEETNEASHEEATSPPQRFKVEAYVCHFPTESQLKRNITARGTRLDKAYASKITYSQAETTHWLRGEAPYAPRIHDSLIAAFNEGRTPIKRGSSELRCPLLKDPISLRTIWYVSLTPDDLRKRTDYFNRSRTLMESSVGDLLAGVAGTDDYIAAMEAFFDEYALTVEQCHAFWETLSSLLTAARKSGYCKENPVIEVAAEYRQRHTSESDIRDALTKKTFSIEEEIRMFSLYPELIAAAWQYSSVMLRHLTGLSANELCGLQWRDIVETPIGFWQLLISRQATNNGNNRKPFENAEDFRRLPLLALLSSLFVKRKQNLLENFKIPASELRKCHVFLSDEQIKEKPYQIPSPRKLNEFAKKVIAQLSLDPDIIVLSDEGNGTKETNLTYYHGDIFRSNFDFRARHFLRFNNGQLNYWLGRKQKSTYPKHYCDFSNDLIQLQLLNQLEYWLYLLQPPTSTTSKRAGITAPSSWSSQQQGQCTSVDLDIYAKEDSEFSFSSSSTNAMSVSANIIEEESNV